MSINCWSTCWDKIAGEKPVSEIAHADFSESYEIEMMHIFKLSSGKAVTVHECGCSCYESSQADVEVYPNSNAAIEKFLQYKKDRGGSFSNLEYLELKVVEKEKNENDQSV